MTDARTYCTECQPAAGALQRVHLCAYHAATHTALTLVQEISRWPRLAGIVGEASIHFDLVTDARERALDILAGIAKDVLAQIGAVHHSTTLTAVDHRGSITFPAPVTMSKPNASETLDRCEHTDYPPCRRCADLAIAIAYAEGIREHPGPSFYDALLMEEADRIRGLHRMERPDAVVALVALAHRIRESAP